MTNNITLFNGPNSPFGRKTKITSIVQEISLEEKIIKIQEAEFLDKHNPLRKIPTLLVDELTIIDSDNICFYLDSISNKNTLFPKNNYFEIISMVSVANGLMESVLERRMELIRPNNEQSKNFINKQEIRIERTIKWLENNWKNYNDNYLTMDQIAIACSLEYTNFRLNNKWEKKSQNLVKWLNNFRQKDFMKSTIPMEAK
ncbi:glutathione S-transferase N-terminal domain-containing protein [Candidatus Pelagibacter sp.]|jgi:glutathione S-transferase|nr:glutathione S-transferase N-terminal domain-containing protein [Candidatus Pelagibacter sp.]|tara:strand:- start:326 stop:928 length:603 start_codon:yes stop_codon:yes gene_type:complete